jgi:hypothetical protein
MEELFAHMVACVCGFFRIDPLKDPDREFGYVFLFGMMLLLAVGAGAITGICRRA